MTRATEPGFCADLVTRPSLPDGSPDDARDDAIDVDAKADDAPWEELPARARARGWITYDASATSFGHRDTFVEAVTIRGLPFIEVTGTDIGNEGQYALLRMRASGGIEPVCEFNTVAPHF